MRFIGALVRLVVLVLASDTVVRLSLAIAFAVNMRAAMGDSPVPVLNYAMAVLAIAALILHIAARSRRR